MLHESTEELEDPESNTSSDAAFEKDWQQEDYTALQSMFTSKSDMNKRLVKLVKLRRHEPEEKWWPS